MNLTHEWSPSQFRKCPVDIAVETIIRIEGKEDNHRIDTVDEINLVHVSDTMSEQTHDFYS